WTRISFSLHIFIQMIPAVDRARLRYFVSRQRPQGLHTALVPLPLTTTTVPAKSDDQHQKNDYDDRRAASNGDYDRQIECRSLMTLQNSIKIFISKYQGAVYAYFKRCFAPTDWVSLITRHYQQLISIDIQVLQSNIYRNPDV